MLNRNRIYSLCVIAFGLLLMYETSQLTSLFRVSSRDVGPRFFPYAIAIGLIICAIGKFITENKESEPLFTKEGWKRTFIIFCTIACYLVSMHFVGYLISTPIFTMILVLLMKEGRKINLKILFLFAVIMTAVIYLVFEKIIMIFLPVGVIFG